MQLIHSVANHRWTERTSRVRTNIEWGFFLMVIDWFVNCCSAAVSCDGRLLLRKGL